MPRGGKVIHGMSRSPTWYSWAGMKERCLSPKHQAYSAYGGRGITVCSRWLGRDGFNNFLTDMGEKPAGTTLDRKHNDKGYDPANCHWVTMADQGKNKRNNVQLTYHGRTKVLTEWAQLFKLRSSTLRRRIKAGWSVSAALETPVRKLTR